MKKVFLEKGVKNCLIVIPEDASVVEKTAAEELCEYIEKSLDVKLDTVSESKASGKCIFVGQTEYAKRANVLGKSKENWIVKMVDGNLVLTGGKEKMDRGIIYATYHFLEDIVGVRWWSPFEEDVLSLSELSLDDALYMEGTPAIYHRKPFMHSGVGVEGVAHMARTRTNVISPLDDNIENGVYDPEVRKYGDFQHAGRPHHAHTATKYFPKEEYYDKHPEWWAWNKVEGKHIEDGGLCLCNQELRNAFLEKLMGYIEEDIKLAEETGAEIPCYYSLSQDDLYDDSFCQCDECSKLVEKSGFSGYLINFVNWIAREVAKKYPFIKIEYLAYLSFIEPPKDGTLPEPNVITRLAHLRSDLYHGITEKANQLYLRYLREWSEIAKKSGSGLYIWEYMYNMKPNYPAPLFLRLKDTIKTFYDYGVSGVFVETQASMENMWPINNFVMTHLLENPELDEGELIDDVLMRYYGEAGKYVKEYVGFLHKASRKYMLRTTCTRESSPFNYIDVETAVRGSELLEKAIEVCDGKAPYAARLNWLRKPMDATILYKFFDLKRMAEESGEKFEFDRAALKERIIAALREQAELPHNQGRNGGFIADCRYYEEMELAEERKFDIPDELKCEKPEDIYQFHMTDMLDVIKESFRKAYGAEFVDDEKAACGRSLKFNPDNAIPILGMHTMRPTSKYVERKRCLPIFIKKNDEIVSSLNMYSEDFAYGDYKLYKVGTVSGVLEQNDVRLAIMEEWEFNISISGIAVNFPMNECDVYLSMRSTGDVYGGKPGEENAFYVDRVVVVRKK